MTHRERMLAAMYGKNSDQIPWAPRMDLWYIACHQKGTLGSDFDNLNTVEIAQKMGFACHAVRADFTLPRTKEDLILRGFGMENHPDFPYRVETKNLPTRFEYDEENLKTWISTPAGEIHTHIRQSGEMLKDGISLPFILSYPIQGVEDFEKVAQVFENLDVIPTPENYRAFQQRLGDQGVAVANGITVASPIHFMLHDLIAMDKFYYLYTDNRDEMYALAERMEGFFNKVLDAIMLCDCETFLWGSNYDQNTTYPAFFAEEIKPWLDRVGKRARDEGKLVLTHTDGENQDLLSLYRDTDFHIAESVCTSPMTRSTLKEFRDGVGPEICTWGGIPAVALMEEAMSEKDFDAHLDQLFGELGDGGRLILGVSDNVPPSASLKRMDKIQGRIEKFGAAG